MTLSRTAEATRYVLKAHRDEALEGTLTVDDVVYLVREVVPAANVQGIYKAIEDYGPIGEGPDGQGDLAWYRRAQQLRIPSWFYNPKTGEALA
jgi:hypothetical protein